MIEPVRFVSDTSVVIAKLALLEPAGTSTVAGTWIFGLPQVSLIVAPGPLAVALKLMVPVEPSPAETVAGEKPNEEGPAPSHMAMNCALLTAKEIPSALAIVGV